MNYHLWVLTCFPEFYQGFSSLGVVGQVLQGKRALAQNHYHLETINLYDHGIGPHKKIDDSPYGGGGGMVLRADSVERALLHGVDAGAYATCPQKLREEAWIILMSARAPKEWVWSQEVAQRFSTEYLGGDKKHLIFIASRYQGIDERLIESYVDLEISLGDYILSGGDLAVMSVLDSALRLLPGTLGSLDSLEGESHGQEGLLEHPHYTKPDVFHEKRVPDVLKSGHHGHIKAWRTRQAQQVTQKRRPDLWKRQNHES